MRRSSTNRKRSHRNKIHVANDVSEVGDVISASKVELTPERDVVRAASMTSDAELREDAHRMRKLATSVPPTLTSHGPRSQPVPVPKPRVSIQSDVSSTKRGSRKTPVPMARSGQARVAAVARRANLDRQRTDRRLQSQSTSGLLDDLDFGQVKPRSRSDSWDLERYEMIVGRKKKQLKSIETETSFDDASHVDDVSDGSLLSRTCPASRAEVRSCLVLDASLGGQLSRSPSTVCFPFICANASFRVQRPNCEIS